MAPSRTDMRLKVRTFGVPMFVVAAALFVLIATLATLQYWWLGQISDAERDRMTSNLGAQSTGLAQEFDHEITRAYATFQLDASIGDENHAARLAARHERWTATARYPRLVREVYIARPDDSGVSLQRFSPTTRFIEPVEWPASLEPVRDALSSHTPRRAEIPKEASGTFFIATLPATVWDQVPALVIPMPLVFTTALNTNIPGPPHSRYGFAGTTAFVIVLIDRNYLVKELLPAMVAQRFHSAGTAYQVAVVSASAKNLVYTSDQAFSPLPNTKGDASADLFQVRLQEFSSLFAETRRITTGAALPKQTIEVHRLETTPRSERPGSAPSGRGSRGNAPVSIMVQQSLGARERSAIMSGAAAALSSRPAPSSPRWRLVVKHPSGSLEAAVNAARRRNIIVSTSVMALLGISVGFLIVTTRRAQELAQQQMEFVAAVSHELRTPLAVIRSAADNLAEGVVHEHPQVRKYGDLVRVEGRRLSEMVEQILELAGIQSGQRSFALRPVPLVPILHDVVRSSATLIEDAGVHVEFDIPDTLPPVLGEEAALRRVFQNLIGNAIKYGASGRWVGIKAHPAGREIVVTVADRGIGIPAAEQTRIFEPFYRAPNVVDAQIQGAGLGLSLVQRIVEAHGGRITVRSAEGSGSEFSLHLPAAGEESVARTSATTDPANSLS